MIGRLFFAALGAAIFAGSMVTAQAKTAASPLVALQLKGHWVCALTGGAGDTYNQDWTAALDGTWLRATDSAKGVTTAEHTVTFSKATGTWIDFDAFATGAYDVLHGTASGASHLAFRAVYPKLDLSVTYNRLTPARYTLDATGNVQGEKVVQHSDCVKH